jgi:hypothetical protein
MRIEEIILAALIAAFFASIIPRKLKEREKFIEGANEFRRDFTQALVDIRKESGFLGCYSIDTDSFKKLPVTYLHFRYFLKGTRRDKYDEAWDQYHFDCEYQFNSDDASREKIIKDIELLLEFTEYRFLQHIIFIWRKYTFSFFYKYFPKALDKKTKELLEKFSKHDEPPKK